MTSPNDAPDDTGFDLEGITVKPKSVSRNIDPEVVMTTRDKVENALHRELPHYVPNGELASVTGLFLGLLAAVVTADFGAFLGLNGDMWRGVFIIAAAGAGVWTLISIYRWLRRPGINAIINAIVRETRGLD